MRQRSMRQAPTLQSSCCSIIAQPALMPWVKPSFANSGSPSLLICNNNHPSDTRQTASIAGIRLSAENSVTELKPTKLRATTNEGMAILPRSLEPTRRLNTPSIHPRR